MVKPDETLSLSQCLDAFLQEARTGLQLLANENPRVHDLSLRVNALSQLEAEPSTPLYDGITGFVDATLNMLLHDSANLTESDQNLIKRMLAWACLIKHRSKPVIEINDADIDLFQGVIEAIPELYSSQQASSSFFNPMIKTQSSESNDPGDKLFIDYLHNNKPLFILEFNQSIRDMLGQHRHDELLVISWLYPQGFNQMYPKGYMMAWILWAAIQEYPLPLYVLDLLWIRGVSKERQDYLPIVSSFIYQLKRLLKTPSNILEKNKLNFVLDQLVEIIFDEPSIMGMIYKNIDWLVFLASKKYYPQLEKLLDYKPGIALLSQEQRDNLLVIYSKMPGSVDLIKKVYHLSENRYLTSTNFREINPIFSQMLDNALKNDDIKLFQYLITRQPMCSGHSRFLFHKAIAADKYWAVDELLSNPNLVVDANEFHALAKSKDFIHAHKMIGRLSLEENGRAVYNLINDTIRARLDTKTRVGYIALLFRMLNIGVLDGLIYSLIQLVAIKTRDQRSSLSSYQLMIVGMLLTALQRERTLDIKPLTRDKKEEEINVLTDILGFNKVHPHRPLIFSYFISIDHWVMKRRAIPGYQSELGAAFFVSGTSPGRHYWPDKRYYFLGISDNFFKAFIRFIQKQRSESIQFKKLVSLLDSAFIWASKFKTPAPVVASSSFQTGQTISRQELLHTGSVDRAYSSSVPTAGHARLSQSGFFFVEHTTETSTPPKPQSSGSDEELLFVMDDLKKMDSP